MARAYFLAAENDVFVHLFILFAFPLWIIEISLQANKTSQAATYGIKLVSKNSIV